MHPKLKRDIVEAIMLAAGSDPRDPDQVARFTAALSEHLQKMDEQAQKNAARPGRELLDEAYTADSKPPTQTPAAKPAGKKPTTGREMLEAYYKPKKEQ